MFDEELNSSLESALLSSFHFRVAHITTDTESVGASLPVFSLISRRKFSITQDFVSLGLSLKRELLIDSAAVDQQRNVGLGIFLNRNAVS